ncbi:hypothetical protein J2W35_002116 [Variovorax boronicumulans]|uniref:RNA-directed DNA polymerase n=1 Tax=Variovorax boronicumulans TaxID=436515 RepID=UPI00278B01BD|nr:RNA-directed DNA polymerase [Variovorax boronicumulans]MDQ0081777.1 hypothetical protein [Variovorax boronicumulans]
MTTSAPTPDTLDVASIDWALTHILRHGDTDLFPVPFEYEAITNSWANLKKRIAAIDLTTYEVRPATRMLLPKQTFGFRVALQLDPIDTIVYTALAYECADAIEAARIPRDQRVACSYRFQKSANGDLFEKSNGWDDFHEHGQELASSGKYSKVITADIADFYNQVGHHRVRNALEQAGLPARRALNVEQLLMNFTGGQSRGLPVGPTASVIFSEACLNDVDMFLIRKGYTHTRYVDDFRIFCEDELTAWHALHDLTEYLYTAHRLALQSSKTKMLDVADFVHKELIDPQEMESATVEEKMDALAELAANYGEPGENLDAQTDAVIRENLQELLKLSLEGDQPQLGMAKYLLRRATSLRTGVVRELVFENFTKLLPILREVALYLTATTNDKFSAAVAERLLSTVEKCGHDYLRFTRAWTADLLMKRLQESMHKRVESFVEANVGDLGLRPRALLAKEIKQIDWVRERKETWQNNTPWDRRAIIWSSLALSRDEMNYWLKRVQNAGDLLDNAIAEAALAVGNAGK